MEEQLISFETAKLAKKRGFIISDRFYYHNNKLYFGNDKKTNLVKNPEVCSASTQALLQKWLREEYDIHITLTVDPFSSGELYGYKIYLVDKGEMKCVKSFVDLNTSYENALEIALQKALEYI